MQTASFAKGGGIFLQARVTIYFFVGSDIWDKKYLDTAALKPCKGTTIPSALFYRPPGDFIKQRPDTIWTKA